MLWSLVAHKKLFLFSGDSVILNNVSIAVTISDSTKLSARLRRGMGGITLLRRDE